ncbi:Cytochrome P450 [Moelleriella libera RCEF 2490]|uniref:Cytochrome P450 n=1 Tax=Moelleriella libera RCEF 2490 TaxID=1081109 RepID=A0A167WYP3_9HYPO|nr:Cytochrome P450 [Moelleriella libera RCEF 2490]
MASILLDNINGAQTTTTAALTYVFWNLACNPERQEMSRKKLTQLDLDESDGLPRFSDIDKAPVLDASIRESFRINPISSGRAERVIPHDEVYDGVIIAAGVSFVLITAA